MKSVEVDVDELWMFILRRYFPNDERSGEEWSIVQQQHPARRDPKKADILIRIVSGGYMTNMFFLEDKRYKYEARSSTWASALTQLENYMKESKHQLITRQRQSPRDLYGAVNIGRHVRFYVMGKNYTTLSDLMPKHDNSPYEIRRDELSVDRILMYWHDQGMKYADWR